MFHLLIKTYASGKTPGSTVYSSTKKNIPRMECYTRKLGAWLHVSWTTYLIALKEDKNRPSGHWKLAATASNNQSDAVFDSHLGAISAQKVHVDGVEERGKRSLRSPRAQGYPIYVARHDRNPSSGSMCGISGKREVRRSPRWVRDI